MRSFQPENILKSMVLGLSIMVSGLLIYAIIVFSQYVLLGLAFVYMFSGIFARAAYSWQRSHRTRHLIGPEAPSHPPVPGSR